MLIRFLTASELRGLKEYTYRPGGYTWLDKAHQPFWNWLVNQLPLWLAPNLITLTGLIAVFLSYWLVAFYQPSFIGTSPGWVMVIAGLAVCIYVNLDCIDGKQARRTGTSSPLGQLFDHGCDAYLVHLIIGDLMAAMGESCGWKASLGTVGIMLPWLLAQWEEYHTGVMLYGNGIWGVTEALYSTALVHFFTALVGFNVWKMPVQDFTPLPIPFSPVDLVLITVATTGGLQALGQVWRTLTADGSTLSIKEKGNKRLGSWNAFMHLMLIGILLTCGFVWISSTQIENCRWVYTAYGTFYAYISTYLIVAHMAKTEFRPPWWSFLVLIFCAINSVFSMTDTNQLTVIICLLSNLLYFHYILSIVQQICKFLDIWCLMIKKTNLKD